MISTATQKRKVYLFLYLMLCCSLKAQDSQDINQSQSSTVTSEIDNDTIKSITLSHEYIHPAARSRLQKSEHTIHSIIIEGNRLVSKESILVRLPYKVGDLFKSNLSAQAIKNVFALGYFRQVQVYVDIINDEEVDLCIAVTEKPKVTDVIIKGAKGISDKDLKKETGLDKIQTINEEELKNFAAKIKKQYIKKNYHFADVQTRLETVDEHHVIAHFNVKEGQKAYVRRINFKNNHAISTKQLKKVIITKEVWPMSIMDHSGSYQPEMIEADKAMLEDAYKCHGFVHAAVTNVDIQFDEKTSNYDITYTINEGDMYFIKEVNLEGNDILPTAVLKNAIPVQPGQRYSVEKLRTSIERLRLLWGEFGYIFADIEPTINVDEETKTVSVGFSFDLKDKVYLNRVSIKGNKKARDKIIRRQITLDEGDLITNKKMDQSKDRVKMMGYFAEPDGVNWKITRIDEEHADLDLMLKEIKTGKFNFQLSYGGTAQSATTNTSGFVGSVIVADTNLWGSGIAARALGELAERQQSLNLQLMNPWMFDKPIRGSFDTYFRRSEYSDGLTHTERQPLETVMGGFLGSGYLVKFMGESIVEAQLGFETINFAKPVEAAKRLSNKAQQIYQLLLTRTFQSGDQYWARVSIGQDQRNGIVFTTNGFQWNWYSQLAFPLTTDGFNFFKTELDASWYTPLIGDNSLVLCLHGHLGFIHPLNDRNAPWKSLFHIGGPATIRGYTYGQVGPTWEGDSMGATKAFNFNVEFIVPLTADLTTRAVVFYDGGAGWDMPYKDDLRTQIFAIDPTFSFDQTLKNDAFFYRHSVGAGIRMLNPTPLQVDFGIKLNPSKLFKNKLTELHFSMTHEF
ncbi:MAG: outer membrane protein assembly factor BamA [Candidatus Chromulinivorax sp.]|nr:outer membrane protein assembly factor BamA [Candidatus Chromulinivorax sp.]